MKASVVCLILFLSGMFSNGFYFCYRQEREEKLTNKYNVKEEEKNLKMPLIFSKAMEKFGSKKE